MRNTILSTILLATIAATMTAQEPGNFAVVNGLKIYYETHGPKGKGPPLVLLHGGVGGGEMFRAHLPGPPHGRRGRPPLLPRAKGDAPTQPSPRFSDVVARRPPPPM